MADATLWFIRQQGVVQGPLGGNTLKTWAAEGKIGPHDDVSRSAGGPWHPASQIKGLFASEAGHLEQKTSNQKTPDKPIQGKGARTKVTGDAESASDYGKKSKPSNQSAKSEPLSPKDKRLFWAVTIGLLSWFFVVPFIGLKGTWLYSGLAAAAIGYATTFLSNRKGEPPAWIVLGMGLCGLLTVGGCFFNGGGTSASVGSGFFGAKLAELTYITC